MPYSIIPTEKLRKLNVVVDPAKLLPVKEAIKKRLTAKGFPNKKVEVEVAAGGKGLKVTVPDLNADQIKKAFE